jgi:hypothetical protein
MAAGRLTTARDQPAPQHFSFLRKEGQLRVELGEFPGTLMIGNNKGAKQLGESFPSGRLKERRDFDNIFQRNQGRIPGRHFIHDRVNLVRARFSPVGAQQESRPAGARLAQQRNAFQGAGSGFYEKKLQLLLEELLDRGLMRGLHLNEIGQDSWGLEAALGRFFGGREQ